MIGIVRHKDRLIVSLPRACAGYLMAAPVRVTRFELPTPQRWLVEGPPSFLARSCACGFYGPDPAWKTFLAT